MRNSSTAIFTLIAGLLLGGGLGFFLGQSGSVQASGGGRAATLEVGPDRVAQIPASAPADAADLGSVGALPSVESTDSGQGSERGLTAAEDARASRAAATALGRVSAAVPDEDPTWTGVIHGTVADDLGAPLAGVTVMSQGPQSWYSASVVAGSTEKVGRAFPGVKALEEELEIYAGDRVKGRKKTRMAVTDAAGGFTLEGLEPGTHLIRGYLEDHVVKGSNIETGATGKLVARRVGAFELDVRLPDGSQPAEAIVMATDEEDDEEVAGRWTPEEPVIRFASVKVRCRVLAGEPRKIDWRAIAAEFQSPLATLDLAADGQGPHVIQLHQETQVRVTVIDESDAVPRMAAWVRVKPVSEQGGQSQELKRFRSGPFIAMGIELGEYEVTAGRGKSAPELTQTMEIVEGVNELVLTLGEVDPSRFIQVRCTGPGGVPVTAVDFRYQSVTGNGSSSGGASAILKGPGEFWIDESEVGGQQDEAVAVTALTLTAKTALYGSIKQDLDLSARLVEFQFEEPGDVTVEVTGSRTSSLRVSLSPVKDPDEEEQWWRQRGQVKAVDSEGVASMGLLQPGDYELKLTAGANDGFNSPSIASQTVNVRPGKVILSIAAPSLSEVVVHVPEGKAGTQVGLQKRSEGQVTAGYFGNVPLDDQLRARFEGLAPGTYVVQLWGGETQGQMEITVPCGEVVFTAQKINGFEVTQVTAGKMADEAGLKKGDIILAVNEHQVEGNGFLNRFWVELGEGPSTVLISRGGGELNVELPKLEASANTWGAFGAYMTPSAVAR